MLKEGGNEHEAKSTQHPASVDAAQRHCRCHNRMRCATNADSGTFSDSKCHLSHRNSFTNTAADIDSAAHYATSNRNDVACRYC
jgi:hypothetical protein